MAAVSMENICWAVISGIEKAQIDYEEMSGGEWLWTAAEYMLTTYIAKEIHELEGSKFVTVESNGLSTMDFAGARAPGPNPEKHCFLAGLTYWCGGQTQNHAVSSRSKISRVALLAGTTTLTVLHQF